MTNIQERMFLETRNKKLFHQTQSLCMEYLDQIFDRGVFPSGKDLSGLEAFDEDLPESPGDALDVIGQLHRYGSPATTATLGGRYFGFVIGSSIPVGLAAKSLATFWDQAPAMHVLSPVCGKLESVVEKWLVDLFQLPAKTCAGFVSGTSTANLCGLAAARFRILKNSGWDINAKGLRNAPPIRIVAGRHAHSTVLKAISILGLGTDSIEWVPVDDQGRMIVKSLPRLDRNTITIIQAGNVNSGAFEDMESICRMAEAAGSWVHIDGAFGLWAAASGKLKHLARGSERATSLAVDGHKTLNTPYDCGIVLCTDEEALTSALHTSGSYLVESPERDGMFYTPEMSRRARIVELWAVLKYLGKSGIDQMVTGMHQRALQFSREVAAIPGFEVVNKVVFNQVLVKCETDDLTLRVLKNIQEQRVCWLGGSEWFGSRVMRISICSWATTAEDITRAVHSFSQALDRELKGSA